MPKISFSGCLGRSPVISTQFTLEVCMTASHREKILNPYFGGSRSFKVIDVGRLGCHPAARKLLLTCRDAEAEVTCGVVGTVRQVSVRASTDGLTSLRVQWGNQPQERVDGAVTGYRVMYRRHASAKSLQTVDLPGDAEQYVIRGTYTHVRYVTFACLLSHYVPLRNRRLN